MAMKRMTKADHPSALGAFKPVGHVVLALRGDAEADATARALLEAGFDDEDIVRYSAAEELDEMERMLQYTSEFAGFGYEVSLMREYHRLARSGAAWLVVYAPDAAHTVRIAGVARRQRALLAQKYHRWAIEDLL